MSKRGKAWSSAEKTTCISLFKKAKSDAEVYEKMKKKFPGRPWTVHSIRSYRGRLERAGELKRGISGSGRKPKNGKKPKRGNALTVAFYLKELEHQVEHLESRLDLMKATVSALRDQYRRTHA